MLTARPDRSKDSKGGKEWTPFNSGGWPHGFFATQGRRPYMEDIWHHVVMKNGINFFAVYDGHSGTRCAQYLQENLANQVEEAIASVDYDNEEAMSEAIKKSYLECDQTFLAKAVEERWHDGSTATTAFVLKNTVYVANVGDSRTTLVRLGASEPLSQDHKPSRPEERDRLIMAGATIIHVGVPRVNGLLATSRLVLNPKP